MLEKLGPSGSITAIDFAEKMTSEREGSKIASYIYLGSKKVAKLEPDKKGKDKVYYHISSQA